MSKFAIRNSQSEIQPGFGSPIITSPTQVNDPSGYWSWLAGENDNSPFEDPVWGGGTQGADTLYLRNQQRINNSRGEYVAPHLSESPALTGGPIAATVNANGNPVVNSPAAGNAAGASFGFPPLLALAALIVIGMVIMK